MQTQQYDAAPYTHDYYSSSAHVFTTSLPDEYLAPTQNSLNYGGFSRGSLPYPRPEYQYFPDRGRGPSSSLASSSIADTTPYATGMSIAGNPNSSYDAVFRPEGIPEYDLSQQWQWMQPTHASIHGHGASTALPTAHKESTPAIKSTTSYGTVLRSPAAQLPTPAAMAVLLNHNSNNRSQAPTDHQATPARAPSTGQPIPMQTRTADVELQPSAHTNNHHPETHSREKRHACTMCHKRWANSSLSCASHTHRSILIRFDRPSTLRKVNQPYFFAE